MMLSQLSSSDEAEFRTPLEVAALKRRRLQRVSVSSTSRSEPRTTVREVRELEQEERHTATMCKRRVTAVAREGRQNDGATRGA